jgi:hypothetical protein
MAIETELFLLALTLAAVAPRAARGQSGYYNLDSGRPTRVEDALATPRGELEMQLLLFRGEWLGDGTQRGGSSRRSSLLISVSGGDSPARRRRRRSPQA